MKLCMYILCSPLRSRTKICYFFLRFHGVQTLWLILIIFGIMIDIDPQFNSAPSTPLVRTYRSSSQIFYILVLL